MKKQKLFMFPLLLLSLVLGGCKGDSSEDPSSSSEPDVAYEEDLVDLGYEMSTGWPGSKISSFLAEFDITETVPALSVSGKTFTYPVYESEYGAFIEVFIPGADRAEEYEGILDVAGYYIDYNAEDDFYDAYSASELVNIQFYFALEETFDDFTYPAGLTLFIAPLESEGGPGQVGDPTNPASAITFNFSNINQIVGDKNTEMTTWQQSDASFKVEKATSTVDVGNPAGSNDGEGFYQNPLRIYTNQVVTFTAPEGHLIEQIVFTAFSASYAEVLEGVDADITYEIDEKTVIFALNTPASTFSFVVPAQLRVNSITLYFI